MKVLWSLLSGNDSMLFVEIVGSQGSFCLLKVANLERMSELTHHSGQIPLWLL